MSAPILTAGRWFAVWSINCNDATATGVRPAAYSLGVQSAIAGMGGTVLPAPAGGANPETIKTPVALQSRQVITVSASFQVLGGADIAAAALNQRVALAFKNSGAGSGLSAERIGNAFANDDNLAEFFSISPAIARVSADFRFVQGNQVPTVGMTNTVLGSTAGVVASRAVTDSDNPARIGQSIPGVNGNIFDDLAGFVRSLSPGVAIVAGVAAVGAVAVGGAYVYRAVK